MPISSEMIVRRAELSGDSCDDLLLLDPVKRGSLLVISNCRDSFRVLRGPTLPDDAKAFDLVHSVIVPQVGAAPQTLLIPSDDGRRFWISPLTETGELSGRIVDGFSAPIDASTVTAAAKLRETGAPALVAISKGMPRYLLFRSLPLENAGESSRRLPFYAQEPVSELSGISLDGRALFLMNDRSGVYAWDLGDEYRATSATFGAVPTIGRVLLGNFDGQGDTDIVARSGAGLSAWWLAIGRDGTWIEQPGTGLFQPEADDLTAIVADLDGDGGDEIARMNTHRTTLFVSALRKSPETARNSRDSGPHVCLGYGETGRLTSKWGRKIFCPENFAWLEVDDGGRKGLSGYANGTCCRLPADDMLTAEEATTETVCPPEFIAVGFENRNTCDGCTRNCGHCGPAGERVGGWVLVCRRINTRRYQLSDPTSGHPWGVAFSTSGPVSHLSRSDLPASIRFGVGRQGYNDWDVDGCLGEPIGSLYVGSVGDRCDQRIFKEILFVGAPGDPPKGTKVTILPDCAEVENIYDPRSGCRPFRSPR